MIKNLNKEIVVRRTLKWKLIDALLGGIAYTVLLYFCLTEFNEDIVEFMKSIAENNLALEASLILFPFIVLITGFMSIGTAIYTGDSTSTKRTKKSNKKGK